MSATLERMWYPDAPESPGQRLVRAPLTAASLGFRAVIIARNVLFDRGVLRPRRIAGARVISVGNLTVGGAGKTPAVIYLAQRFRAAGRAVAVLSRGYGRRSTRELDFDAQSAPSPEEAGDEPVLIARRCPGVRIYVGANRVRAAERARAHGADVLLLDDGMQHRRLARDADVAVVDEAVGFGNGAMLPRGPLREPLREIRRASLLWIRAAAVRARLPEFPGPTVRALHGPSALLDPDRAEHPPEKLSGFHVHALCALARPSGFVRTLQSLGAVVTGLSAFRDHHLYSRSEVDRIAREARSKGALLVTTEKDWVRLPPDARAWVLRLGVRIQSGEAHLDALLADPVQTG
jgi:tetraacyldisaccharide 4'-kinase